MNISLSTKAVSAVENHDNPGASSLVFPGPDGRLQYTSDPNGNRIPDFSHCGYGGGGVPIPDVPIRAVLQAYPSNQDDTRRIQEAIDELCAQPMDENGFRGALLLKKGQYKVSQTLFLWASGVVLRGEGDQPEGTVILATGKREYDVVYASDLTLETMKPGIKKRWLAYCARKLSEKGLWWQWRQHWGGRICDENVPVGSRSFHVRRAGLFRVGDRLWIRRPSTKKWIQAIGMDRIELKYPSGKQWSPGEHDLHFSRVITAIEGNRITIDAPLGNSLTREYGGGWIYRQPWPPHIKRVGIENLYFKSCFDPRVVDPNHPLAYADEDHAWTAVALGQLHHGWVRNVAAVQFADACVATDRHAKWITIQDCSSSRPVSQIKGGRRYTFTIGGQLILVQRCSAERGRRDFVVLEHTAGPNVFLQCRAIKPYVDSGPHLPWSVATLYDNVITEGRLEVQDRQGIAKKVTQGWVGAQTVFWNCQARELVCQQPPGAQNYCIGCLGEKKPGRFQRKDGYWESHGRPVWPQSLFIQQLQDRLGSGAVANLT